MKIHEYQGKALFRAFDIPVPEGKPAFTVDEAVEVAKSLNQPVIVVKAQIHAGGRGKGGGVAVTRSIEDAKTAAERILGMQLITHQTGPEGQKVKSLLIEAGSAIAKEFYLSVVLDRAQGKPVMMASTEGGMDIEAVAEHSPEKIIRVTIEPSVGIQPFQAREVAFALGLPPEAMKAAIALIMNVYRLYDAKDCSLVEVNPLVLTSDNQIIALDAKITFDENAMYRHPDLVTLRDTDEEDPLEVEASKFNLNYIKLDGNVGCMVNGAGLAMATMDIVKLYGAAPANFLDVGGGANAQSIENAFRILISDASVQVVFINIFGGILRCDLLAEGVIAASAKLKMTQPIVIRMKGTNVERGKQLLADSGLAFTVAETMHEAAEAVARLVKQPVNV
jgi:succinyl-CoA synthetase beta subunit